ncbi:bcl-2-like protein 2 isoform X2 [Salvelinus fontinalis]|uniref:bcl-2-like protein 2 isoform X2 n=1 Tax=Salvelinus fontinalis TaxID=8038 RepID=UPI0024862CE0|nr:bcl-2-like protein 2 isoform X2 [Salvelinus fontinalis]
MSPRDIEQQTFDIISCFFEEEQNRICNRKVYGSIESDGPGDGDGFDPVVIADKLRELGDDFDVKFIQPHIRKLRQAVADKAVEEFARSVDSLCAAQGAEVAPEMQLLRASMALGLYVKKTCPDLRATIQSCMTAFINTRLAGWINQQGGWDQVTMV